MTAGFDAIVRAALSGLIALTLGACATVPDGQRLLFLQAGGQVAAASQACGGTAASLARSEPGQDALNPQQLRIASWNIHKGEDEGWQADLGRYARDSDLLLLQEAVLVPAMREVIEAAGHRWQMAAAFAQGGVERGVLLAARVAPISVCTLRSFEPLFPLPKSALVARYRLAGRDKNLAVANLHGINFTLGLARFGEQIEDVAAELARHDGPIVLGGDFNTWSEERHDLLQAVAQRLGLTPVFSFVG
jgi:endonuclease/exonuclease/phosphatase (EEP) superfamily protein YafD